MSDKGLHWIAERPLPLDVSSVRYLEWRRSGLPYVQDPGRPVDIIRNNFLSVALMIVPERQIGDVVTPFTQGYANPPVSFPLENRSFAEIQMSRMRIHILGQAGEPKGEDGYFPLVGANGDEPRLLMDRDAPCRNTHVLAQKVRRHRIGFSTTGSYALNVLCNLPGVVRENRPIVVDRNEDFLSPEIPDSDVVDLMREAQTQRASNVPRDLVRLRGQNEIRLPRECLFRDALGAIDEDSVLVRSEVELGKGGIR